jgi:hypothetical protein
MADEASPEPVPAADPPSSSPEEGESPAPPAVAAAADEPAPAAASEEGSSAPAAPAADGEDGAAAAGAVEETKEESKESSAASEHNAAEAGDAAARRPSEAGVAAAHLEAPAAVDVHPADYEATADADDAGAAERGLVEGAGDDSLPPSHPSSSSSSSSTTFSKAYMGGLRDRASGRVFHHAVAQTPVERVSKWANAAPRYSREVQTTTATTRSQQVRREGAAQTNRSDLHRDRARDTVLVPRPYFTAEQLLEVKHLCALRIQCQWRGALARKRAEERLAALRAEALAAEAAADEAARAERERLQRDVERRMHPRTAGDFAALYDEVEAWRTTETERIHAEYPAASASAGAEAGLAADKARKAALCALLAKESALVATIERLRVVAGKENKEGRVRAMMDAMAAPQSWHLSTGDLVSVMTPLATRAGELRRLYEGLCDDGLGREARLDLLLNVKYTVKEFDGCALVKEMAELIDREVDMLKRGRPLTSMPGLRTRLRSLFQLFVSDPKFNPAAIGHTAGHMPPSERDPKLLPSFLQPTVKKH